MENRGYSMVSMVIPAYNEEAAVPRVVDEVHAALKKAGVPYEIIIVDDCSTDKTAILAEKHGARVVRRKRRGGSGASRKTGILSAKGDIVVMLDADGTYNAADIPALLAYFPEYDQVIGARTSEEGTMKILRIPAKKFIIALASFLANVKIPDLNSGLRGFKKDIMMKYLWVIPDGFSCVSSMTLTFLCNGFNVAWFPTKYSPRIGRSKFHPIRDTYSYILTVTRIVMHFNPLRVFFPMSFFLVGVGVIKSLYDRFFSIHRMQQLDIVIVLAGIMIGVLGLLADLIVTQGKALRYVNER